MKKILSFGVILLLITFYLPSKALGQPSSTYFKTNTGFKNTPGTLAQGNENWDDRFDLLGLNGEVNAIAVDGSGNVYVGGFFTTAAAVTVNYIAKWDGSSWSALGSGLDNYVNAIAVSGNDVYVGGAFTTAGGSAANYIAKWDGNNWSALGTGTSAFVNALAVDGNGNLYAGGSFTSAGSVSTNYIAKWDGSSWSALSGIIPGFLKTVNTISIAGNDVYVGGTFDGVIAVPNTRYLAKWNTLSSSWSALGTGVSGGLGSVRAITASGSDIYVGGNFTTAGGITVNRVAKWDGSSWSALGIGVTGGINGVAAITVSGSSVFAGGFFTQAGGISSNYIAKWDGSAWSAMGNGVTGFPTAVTALASFDNNVYAGGSFTSAGDKTSNYFGIWDNRDIYSGPSNDTNTDHLKLYVSGSSGPAPTIQFYNEAPGTGDLSGTGMDHVSQYRWAIDATGLTFTEATIRVPIADLEGVTDQNTLAWLKRSTEGSGAWTNIGGNINGSYLESDPFTGFSEFVIASSIPLPDNPLPVELSSFSGISTLEGVKLEWITQSETDNAGFILYRNGLEIASHKSTNALIGYGTTSQKHIYHYTDADVALDNTYIYSLESSDYSGLIHLYPELVEIHVAELNEIPVPYEFSLSQNYPNPFNPVTRINFSMKQAGMARFNVYDLLGRLVYKKDIRAKSGSNFIDFKSGTLTSGMYLYELTADGFTKTMKMMIVK